MSQRDCAPGNRDSWPFAVPSQPVSEIPRRCRAGGEIEQHIIPMAVVIEI